MEAPHFGALAPKILEGLVLGRTDARGTTPIAPTLRFQVPAARCAVSARPGYYSLTLFLDAGRPAHDAFVAAMRHLERALCAATGNDSTTMAPIVTHNHTMYLSVRDDTEWFDTDASNIRGSISVFPNDFKGVSVTMELGAVWSRAGKWGPRTKVLQAKRADPARLRAPQPMFLDEPDWAPEPMFIEEDD